MELDLPTSAFEDTDDALELQKDLDLLDTDQLEALKGALVLVKMSAKEDEKWNILGQMIRAASSKHKLPAQLLQWPLGPTKDRMETHLKTKLPTVNPDTPKDTPMLAKKTGTCVSKEPPLLTEAYLLLGLSSHGIFESGDKTSGKDFCRQSIQVHEPTTSDRHEYLDNVLGKLPDSQNDESTKSPVHGGQGTSGFGHHVALTDDAAVETPELKDSHGRKDGTPVTACLPTPSGPTASKRKSPRKKTSTPRSSKSSASNAPNVRGSRKRNIVQERMKKDREPTPSKLRRSSRTAAKKTQAPPPRTSMQSNKIHVEQAKVSSKKPPRYPARSSKNTGAPSLEVGNEPEEKRTNSQTETPVLQSIPPQGLPRSRPTNRPGKNARNSSVPTPSSDVVRQPMAEQGKKQTNPSSQFENAQKGIDITEGSTLASHSEKENVCNMQSQKPGISVEVVRVENRNDSTSGLFHDENSSRISINKLCQA